MRNVSFRASSRQQAPGLCVHTFCVGMWPVVIAELYLGKRVLVISYRNQISSTAGDSIFLFWISGVEALEAILGQSLHFPKKDVQRQ